MGDEPEKKVEEIPRDQTIYSAKRMELCIKECPQEIAHAFFTYARENWHGKQWVALKDLLRIAMDSEKMEKLEEEIAFLRETVKKHEYILSKVKLVPEEKSGPEGEERTEDPEPRGFGGKK